MLSYELKLGFFFVCSFLSYLHLIIKKTSCFIVLKLELCSLKHEIFHMKTSFRMWLVPKYHYLYRNWTVKPKVHKNPPINQTFSHSKLNTLNVRIVPEKSNIQSAQKLILNGNKRTILTSTFLRSSEKLPPKWPKSPHKIIYTFTLLQISLSKLPYNLKAHEFSIFSMTHSLPNPCLANKPWLVSLSVESSLINTSTSSNL